VNGSRVPTWGLPDALWCWLAGFVGAAVAVSIGSATSADVGGTAFLFAVLVPFQYAAILGVVAIVSRAKGTGSLHRDFGFRVLGRDAPMIALGGALQIAVVAALAPIAQLGHLSKEPQELVRRAQHDAGGALLVLIVVVTTVLAPAVEELVFRGVLLRALLRRTSDGWAIGLSAAVFAGAHLTDPGARFVLPGLFGLGLVLGALAVRDGVLSRPVLVHGGFNLIATLLSLPHR